MIAATMLRRLLSRLPFRLKFEVFYQFGRLLGVDGYTVIGKNGTVVLPLLDVTIAKGYLQNREWSLGIVNIFNQFLSSVDKASFLDIGANIGLVTAPLAKRHNASFFVFEPDALNCQHLRANLALNCPDREVHVIEAAVYKQTDTLQFQKNDHNSGNHHISTTGNTTVRAIRLDDVDIPDSPLAAKIDTEGAEPWVFEGGRKTLARADLIVFEFSPLAIREMGCDALGIIEFIGSFFSYGGIMYHDCETPELVPIAQVQVKLRDLWASTESSNYVDVLVSKKLLSFR